MATIKIKDVTTLVTTPRDTDKIPVSQNDNTAKVITLNELHEYEKSKADQSVIEDSTNTITGGAVHDALEQKANPNGEYDNMLVGLAKNLKNWADRDSLSVEDTFVGVVQTAGGNVSIDSSLGSKVVSIVANTNFAASLLRNTGFNLLRNATTIGQGYYFLVPALEFGSYGTAIKPNGILFTKPDGTNIAPSVYFKKLADGVPTSSHDGTPISPVVSNGHSFYCTSEPGYMVVEGISSADVCAHVAWSRRYDEYVAIGSASDAGATLALTSIINAIHSYGYMLVVGSGRDRIDFNGTQAVWTRNCDRVAPSWTTEANVVEAGQTQTYTHKATISGMHPGGNAYVGINADIVLSVDGTSVQYTDANSAATSDYVYYQLATPATGTISISNEMAIEDFGLTYLEGVTGDAFVTMQYAQGYPDGVAQLLATFNEIAVPVICAAFAQQQQEIDALKKLVSDTDDKHDVYARNVDIDSMSVNGFPMVLTSTTAGAPGASIVPDNWNSETMGQWTGVTQFVGQLYVDKASKKVYFSTNVTNSTADWVVLN